MAVDPIKVQFGNHQFLGDVICSTPLPRDMAVMRRCTDCLTEGAFPKLATIDTTKCPNCGRNTFRHKYLVKPVTRFPEIWDGNPYISDFDNPDITLKLGTGLSCNASNTSGKHITCAFRDIMIKRTDFNFPQGEQLPDLHLTEYEKKMPPIIEGRYWVICIGKRPPFTSKFWPPERWQEVVNALPDITFVQTGHSEHEHQVLTGDNMINMIGQTEDERTGLRDLFRLVYYADGCCTLVSSLMHIAAGFRKPAVVIAGGREPARFEMYPFHAFLHNQGAMSCEGKDMKGYDRSHTGVRACWKESADACPNLDNGFPKCMTMIESRHVIEAIQNYYEGGQLKPIEQKARIKPQSSKPVFKLVTNTHAWGGGERSSAWLANRMLEEGYHVQLIPTGSMSKDYKAFLSPYVEVTKQLRSPCALLLVYTNDMVFGFNDKFKILAEVQAERKVMALNYRLGAAGKLDWTQTWDRYIFLCSDMEQGFLDRVPDADTVILPPPVDLTKFIEMDLGSLNKTRHIVRVSSQTSKKMPENIADMVKAVLEIDAKTQFTFMGGHPSLSDIKNVECFNEYSEPVEDILRKGTTFWYALPDGYLDNGPRVIMEAMAAGLPVVCDNRGGAKDRVTDECGWLCNNPDDHIRALVQHGKEMARKGKVAKERAKTFDPDRWIEAIVGRIT